MAIIKEKGHNISLSNIIIHKISKDAGQKIASVKFAESEIPVSDSEIKFLADVRESFNKKSVPTYGIFDDSIQYNGFQQALKLYKDEEISFLEFSKDSMNYYKRIIETSAPATGGFLIFADYVITDNNDRYILVLAIDNKQGYNLNEAKLAIQEIKNLELNKMDLASIINLTRWDLSIQSDSDIKTYLTFIRGKKKISDYFQKYIGCADKTTATESSTLLLRTFESYVRERDIPEAKAKELKGYLFDYCKKANKGKEEISLAQISFIIDSENPDDFLNYATDERFGNSEVIKYDGKVLRTLRYIDFESEDFTIKFNKKLIGKDIKFNKEKSSITIINLPKELKAQLEKDAK